VDTDGGGGFEAQAKAYHAAAFSFPGAQPQPMQAFHAWPAIPPLRGYAPPGYAPAAQVVGPPPGYPGMATQFYPTAPVAVQDTQSDSFSIRQLELRAIFRMDREMSEEEILNRSRELPGIRNLVCLRTQDMATVESLKHMMSSLGFGESEPKLQPGSTPLEFIREGSVILAVQMEGGFAPGMREILMLVARELGRMAH
jgi:hypothetical protein